MKSGRKLRNSSNDRTGKKGGNITKELNKNNFESEILESTLPVVVDVWGAW